MCSGPEIFNEKIVSFLELRLFSLRPFHFFVDKLIYLYYTSIEMKYRKVELSVRRLEPGELNE